ncbi:glycosyltransferase family 2 protein [Tenacibaculum amylolyticum]|uniref:glycosyltransferase family 2 protein n=1 Tax=Tenacibaculum amylolyticum TaxID=104269 RepID=UPI0038944BD6
MEDNCLASVITVSYNSGKTIKDTITSVLNQNTDGYEYVIIDGASTDNTIAILKSFEAKFKEKNISYRWFSEPDNGIYDAFNKGIQKSKGKWISFLGSDDSYIENSLQHYINALKSVASDVDFIHGNVKLADKKVFSGEWKWKAFRRNMTIPHAGNFHNKKYFEKYGLFNTSYKIAGDYELLLRAKEQLKTKWINKATVLMSDGGVSNQQIKNVYLETTRAKIETAGVPLYIAKLDYVKWMFKYTIKRILHAFIR